MTAEKSAEWLERFEPTLDGARGEKFDRPRELLELIAILKQTTRYLLLDLGREPTIDEVADRLEVPRGKLSRLANLEAEIRKKEFRVKDPITSEHERELFAWGPDPVSERIRTIEKRALDKIRKGNRALKDFRKD